MSTTQRIQIVEDEYLLARDCECCLAEAGFQCTGVASTATAAFEMAERDRPDLIVMDIRLASGIDGIDTAIVIFEKLGIRSLFVSAHADRLTRGQARLARPLGWLEKPYTHSGLLAAVRSALEVLDTERRAEREEWAAEARTMGREILS